MKKQPKGQTIEQVTAEAAPPSDREQHLRKQIELHKKELGRLHEELGARAEFMDQLLASVSAAEPFPPWTPSRAPKKVAVTASIIFSDWHIGERIRARETEDFNRYDYAIAQSRLRGTVDSFLKWVQAQRTAYDIRECAVLALGDYISGDIHGELIATNEFPAPEQAVKAGLLLGEMLRVLAGNFSTVKAVCCGADNHGRLTPKPSAKRKAANNYSYVVHGLAQAHAALCRNIAWDVAEGMKHLVNINGWKFLVEHGDTIRGWAGLPFYGFQRAIGREAVRRMNTDKGFHYHAIGHFHVPTVLESRTLVNGSLSGTSEFDHACGRHAPPSQVAFLVHPRHGVFNWVPFHG